MSYDHELLYLRVSLSLQRKPNCSLRELARELHVSRRTIENAVISATGKTFRELQEEFLLLRIKDIFAEAPNATIRKVSLEVGYKSPRSFARAVRRICAVSPRQLRSRIAGELLKSKTRARFDVSLR